MAERDAEWDVRPVPRRVVAVGDLHGDLRAFGAIGRACGVLDEGGSWIGGDTHLVLMGDLVGGAQSRLLLNAVMRLEREARRAGGRVHALLGNHDVLPAAGRFSRMTRKERRAYHKSDFRGDGPYSEWLRRRPSILKIGETVFVHAGLDRWAMDTDPAEVNAQVRAWIAHHQGKGPKPPKSTRWTIDEEEGPMWTRAFKARRRKPKDAPSKKTIHEILDRLGAERIVLGHSPTKSGEVIEHPHYGPSVVLIDTRISDEERGHLGAVVIERGSLSPLYASDRADGDRLAEREAREFARPPSLWSRLVKAIVRLFRRRKA